MRAYRSEFGGHEMELVLTGDGPSAERCRVTIGGVDVTGAELRGRGGQLRGELPDGRAFSVDVTDGVALRGGHATLIVDGQVVPLRGRAEPIAGADPGLLH